MTTIVIPSQRCLDPYFADHRSDTRFVLEAGTYTTRGALHFHDCCSLGERCELIGEGSDRTRIQLEPSIAGKRDVSYHEVIGCGSRSGWSERVRISGISINAAAARPCVGLHVWSSDARIHDVRVTGVWGDPRPETLWEGFGILVNRSGEADSHDGGAVVTDCSVEFLPNPMPGLATRNYATALYVGIESRPGIPIIGSTVSSCRVFGKPTEFLPDVGFGINSATVIEDSTAWGVKRGVFSDTGEGRNSRIERCRFAVGYAALDLKSNNREWDRVNVRMRHCDVEFGRWGGADHVAALILDDQSPEHDQAHFVGVTMEECVLVNRTNGLPAYHGSINARNSGGCGAALCEWIGGWDPAVVTSSVPSGAWRVLP